MMWVVLLLKKGNRIDFGVDVGRIPGHGTQDQFHKARETALKIYPSAIVLAVY